jgi:hypothetical protein
VDLLPTLSKIAGLDSPSWHEGDLLPGFGGIEDPNRTTFSMDAKLSSAHGSLRKVTIAMRKGIHKLIYYTGYEAEDSVELYDMQNDIEELNDLSKTERSLTAALQAELASRLDSANRTP